MASANSSAAPWAQSVVSPSFPERGRERRPDAFGGRFRVRVVDVACVLLDVSEEQRGRFVASRGQQRLEVHVEQNDGVSTVVVVHRCIDCVAELACPERIGRAQLIRACDLVPCRRRSRFRPGSRARRSRAASVARPLGSRTINAPPNANRAMLAKRCFHGVRELHRLFGVGQSFVGFVVREVHSSRPCRRPWPEEGIGERRRDAQKLVEVFGWRPDGSPRDADEHERDPRIDHQLRRTVTDEPDGFERVVLRVVEFSAVKVIDRADRERHRRVGMIERTRGRERDAGEERAQPVSLGPLREAHGAELAQLA